MQGMTQYWWNTVVVYNLRMCQRRISLLQKISREITRDFLCRTGLFSSSYISRRKYIVLTDCTCWNVILERKYWITMHLLGQKVCAWGRRDYVSFCPKAFLKHKKHNRIQKYEQCFVYYAPNMQVNTVYLYLAKYLFVFKYVHTFCK